MQKTMKTAELLKLTHNGKGSIPFHQRILDALTPMGTRGLTMINLGAGDAKMTKGYPFKRRYLVDCQPRDTSPKDLIQADCLQFMRLLTEKVDVIYALDFIEHLTKDDGLEILRLIEDKADVGIIFTPLGDLCVGQTAGPDGHHSGWLPEEFQSRNWNTLICPSFHSPWFDGQTHGAFYAWFGINPNLLLQTLRGET